MWYEEKRAIDGFDVLRLRKLFDADCFLAVLYLAISEFTPDEAFFALYVTITHSSGRAAGLLDRASSAQTEAHKAFSITT